jgi:RsmE family RNA methyltransferase
MDRESPLSIELAQAVCVNEKMDWIIQKAVELGVTRIQPVTTARSIVHLSDERASKRSNTGKKSSFPRASNAAEIMCRKYLSFNFAAGMAEPEKIRPIAS